MLIPFHVSWLLWWIWDDVNDKQISGNMNYSLNRMNQYLTKSRCTSVVEHQVKCRGAVYSLVRIWWTSRHYTSSWQIVRAVVWYWNVRRRFVFSAVPELQRVIPIITCESISGPPDTRVTKGLRIFSESTMLNNSQWIAQENRCQLLDCPVSEPVLYLPNQPGVERHSKPWTVHVSYSKTQLTYSRLTWGIQLSVSSLRNEVQAHLRSTLLSSVMVSNLTPHADSTQRLISTTQALIIHISSHTRHASELCIPTFHCLWISGCRDTECHLSDTECLVAGVPHPPRPQLNIWIYDR